MSKIDNDALFKALTLALGPIVGNIAYRTALQALGVGYTEDEMVSLHQKVWPNKKPKG